MFLFELQIGAAVLLDLLFGDPRWLPHPVRLIGVFCVWSEKIFRKLLSSELSAGIFAVVTVLFLTLALTAVLLLSSNYYSSFLGKVIAVFLLYTTLAARGLVAHSRVVYNALFNTDSLDAARTAVGQIVGRDTAELDRKGIIRACVETVAENMVDGVTAPLFYGILLSLFAPITGIDPLFLAVFGAMGYKAVNTMDSMFGYKNERYLFFGRTAAGLDDLVNWIPARISGLMLVAAAFLLRFDWKNSLRILKRDRLAHASPNAAHSEAAVAGALGIELGGGSIYFGKKMTKPVIGDEQRMAEDRDILRTNDLMFLGSFLFLIAMLVSRFFLLQISS
jgi:adenosylcobinamide-phosphate synthase